MSVSFLSCPISEIYDDTVVRACLLQTMGITRGWVETTSYTSILFWVDCTLRHLCGKRRRDKLEVVLWGAIVNRHLATVGEIMTIVKTLVHHLI